MNSQGYSAMQLKAPSQSTAMRPELSFTYDVDIRPIAGKCTACGELMPTRPSDARDNVDAISWFSQHFIVHHQLKHSAPLDPEVADTLQAHAQ